MPPRPWRAKPANESPTTNMTMSGDDMSDAHGRAGAVTDDPAGIVSDRSRVWRRIRRAIRGCFGLVLGRPLWSAPDGSPAGSSGVHHGLSCSEPEISGQSAIRGIAGDDRSNQPVVAMIAISIAAMIVAIKLAQWFAEQYGN